MVGFVVFYFIFLTSKICFCWFKILKMLFTCQIVKSFGFSSKIHNLFIANYTKTEYKKFEIVAMDIWVLYAQMHWNKASFKVHKWGIRIQKPFAFLDLYPFPKIIQGSCSFIVGPWKFIKLCIFACGTGMNAHFLAANPLEPWPKEIFFSKFVKKSTTLLATKLLYIYFCW